MTPENGLTIHKIFTAAEAVAPAAINDFNLTETLADALRIPSLPAFFTAYLDATVLIGRYVDNTLQTYKQTPIEANHLQRLRLFNAQEELLLWRSGGQLRGRVRRDYAKKCQESKACEVVDANQALFGTEPKATDDPKYTKITEKRGTCLILPFTNLQVDDERQRVFIKTRNYIDYIKETSQATYMDCRFVDFVDHNGDPLQQGGQA